LEFEGIDDMQPKGEYNLPEFGKFINIPQGYKPIISYEIIKSDNLTFTAFQKSRGFKEDDLAVTQTKFMDDEIVSIEKPGIMRNLVLAKLKIRPFIVKEKSVEVIQQVNIRVDFEVDNEATLPKVTSGNKLTDMFNKSSLNPVNQNDRSIELPGKYLIIYNGEENVRQILNYFADWKRQKGHIVDFASTDDIGITPNEIKNYIAQVYEDQQIPLEYVCLIGDCDPQDGITPYNNEIFDILMPNDFTYSLIDGDDNLPDLLVSRISYESIAELQTQIAKVLFYEREVQNEGEWADDYFLVGDHLYSGISTLYTVQNVGEYIQNYNYNANIIELYDAPFNTGIINAINSNIGSIIWRGFGNLSDLESYNVDDLTNSRITPFGSFISCFTNSFTLPNPSTMECLLRAGTPTSPKGLISSIGTVGISHSCFNNIITAGIGKYLYEFEGNNLVAAMNYGMLMMEENFPHNPESYNDWYRSMLIHMGDPGLDLWLKKPELFTIECDSIYATDTQFSITIKDANDHPVSGAIVTLISENFNQRFVTDDSGVLLTNLDNQNNETIKLTISKGGFIPFIRDLDYGTSESIDFHSATFSSQDAGAASNLTLAIKNNTVNSFTGNGTITTESPYISIQDSEISFINVTSGDIANAENLVNFAIAQDCPDQEKIIFNTNFAQFSFPIEMYVRNHNLEITETTCSSDITPGSSITLSFTIKNSGSLATEQSEVTLFIPNQNITIVDSVSTISSLNQGESSYENSFELNVSDETQDELVDGIIKIEQPGYTYSLDFALNISISSIQTATTSAGNSYQIIHHNDYEYLNPPVFNWEELDPEEGGNGEQLSLGLQDPGHPGELWHIELPFELKFYGLNYNEITICSNGFIIPGHSDYLNWMNTAIPSSMAYDPIIAPFWDALIYDDNSNIFTYHDTSLNCFIIQWKNLRTRTNLTPQNFELIIYDQEFHPTYTQNNKLKFQYKEITNDDVGQYDVHHMNHGEYATVGLQSHDLIDGIEYTFSNQYDESAQEITNNTALLITDKPFVHEVPRLIICDTNIFDNEGNSIENPIAGSHVNASFRIKNIGQRTYNEHQINIEFLNGCGEILNTAFTLQDLSPNQEILLENIQLHLSNNIENNRNAIMRLTYHNGFKDDYCDANIKIHNIDLSCSKGYLIDANDDMFINPGEDSILRFKISNNSELEIENLELNLISDNSECITIHNPLILLTNPENEIVADFNISCSEELSTNKVKFTLTYNDFINCIGTQEFATVIGYAEIIQDINFDNGSEDLLLWDCFVTQTSYCGQLPELKLGTSEEDYCNIRMPVSYNDIHNAVAVEFDVYSESLNDPLKIRFYKTVDNYSYSHSLDIVYSTDFEPIHKRYYFTIDDYVDSYYFEIAGDNCFNNNVFIDNFKYSLLYDNPVKLEGYVNLSDNQDPSDIEITSSDSNPSQIWYPDSTGYYQISINPKDQSIYFKNTGYSTKVYDFEYQLNQNHFIYDTQLDLLNAPTNLEYSIENDQILLTWDFDEENRKIKTRNKREISREFQEFQIEATLNGSGHVTQQTTTTSCELMFNSNVVYDIKVTAIYNCDGIITSSFSSNEVHIDYTSNDIPEIPDVFSLSQNYPNPFVKSGQRSETTINFSLPYDSENCVINIYDIRGRRVDNLLNDKMKAGFHNVTWDGCDTNNKKCASGVYFYRIVTENDSKIRKLILIK
jgi:hypothetical protein